MEDRVDPARNRASELVEHPIKWRKRDKTYEILQSIPYSDLARVVPRVRRVLASFGALLAPAVPSFNSSPQCVFQSARLPQRFAASAHVNSHSPRQEFSTVGL